MAARPIFDAAIAFAGAAAIAAAVTGASEDAKDENPLPLNDLTIIGVASIEIAITKFITMIVR